MPRVLIRCIPDVNDFLAGEGVSAETARELCSGLCNVVVALEGLPRSSAGAFLRELESAGCRGVVVPCARAERLPGAIVLAACPAGTLIPIARRLAGIPGLQEYGDLAGDLQRLDEDLSRSCPPPIQYQGKRLDFSGRPLVMGVLNVTPDSFYDGGRFLEPGRAAAQAFQLVEEGADLVDIGGASTRPGSDPVPDPVQLERVLPVLSAVRREWDGWISVDTYSSAVARASLEAGADLINDISAGRMDPRMKEVLAEWAAPCILMHMQGTPKTMQDRPVYEALIPEVLSYFLEVLRAWGDSGVAREKLLIDPGIGFGKTLRHNLCLLKGLRELAVLGRPIVLGTSRKSFIGSVLNRGVEERLAGTLATLAVGALHGAHVLRVHDVAAAKDVLTIVHAIRKS